MPYIVAKRFLKKVLCRKAFKEFVKKMTERNPKVLQAKGQDLIKAIKNIKLLFKYNTECSSMKRISHNVRSISYIANKFARTHKIDMIICKLTIDMMI